MTTPRAPAQVRKLLEQSKHVEDELRAISKHAGVFNPRVIALREKLKENCAAVCVSDARAGQEHVLEQRLWRLAFYNPIEELKRLVRQEGEGSTAPRKGKGARQLLREFLQDAEQFYRSLVCNLQAACGGLGLVLPGDLTGGGRGLGRKAAARGAPAGPPSGRDEARLSAHQSLIFLGDILRYTQVYLKTDAKHRQFKHASLCYRQAAYVWPKSGNPYNQLAVLAIYARDDLGATCHYYRALFSEARFPTARDNLVLLLDKVRSKVESTQVLRRGADSAPGAAEAACGMHLVACSAVLFARAGLDELDQSEQEFLSRWREICEGWQGVEGKAVGARDAKGGQWFCLQVTTLCICNISSAAERAPKGNGGAGAGRAVGAYERDEFVGRALDLALRVQLALILGCGLGSGKANLASPCLPAAHVFASWAAACGVLLLKNPPGLQPQTAALWREYLQVACSLLDSLVPLLAHAGRDKRGALWEDVELRGFTPMALCHRGLRFEPWAQAQRPVESNHRRAVRVLRMMEDLRALTGRPDAFPVSSGGEGQVGGSQGESQGACADDEEEIIVWRGAGPGVQGGQMPAGKPTSDTLDPAYSLFQRGVGGFSPQAFAAVRGALGTGAGEEARGPAGGEAGEGWDLSVLRGKASLEAPSGFPFPGVGLDVFGPLNP